MFCLGRAAETTCTVSYGSSAEILQVTWLPWGDLSLRPCVTQVVAQTVHFLHLNTGLFSICHIWGAQMEVCILKLFPAV